MIYTGIDEGKAVNVSYSPIKKSWEIAGKRGKEIHLIPSHLSLVKKGVSDIKDPYLLKRSLSIEIEEKFGQVLWDVKLVGDEYCLVVAKDFSVPESAYALDSEIFALARVLKAMSVDNGAALDIGRRKTTYVEVVNGRLEFYRVVLKGGDYITRRVAEEKNLDIESAERLKIEKGLEENAVKAALEEIFKNIGREVGAIPTLLSGGGSRLSGLEDLFPKTLKQRYVSQEEIPAFGASLKFVYEDCSPDFREEEVSAKDLKKILVLLGSSLLIFLGANLLIDLSKKEIIKEIKRAEKRAFKKVFPNLPTVAVRDQVKSMVGKESFKLTKSMIKAAEILPEDMSLYKIEFNKGKLKIVGEVGDKKLLKGIKVKKVKKTPEGKFEFELEVE